MKQRSMFADEKTAALGHTKKWQRLMWHLRIYGPCSVAELIRTTGWSRGSVVSCLYSLRKIGYARGICRACYDLTETGRRVLGVDNYLESTEARP